MNDPRQRRRLMWMAAIGGGLLISLLFVSVFAPSAPDAEQSLVLRPGAGEAIEQAAPAQNAQGFSLGGGELASLAWRLALVVVIIVVSVAGLRWWARRATGPKSTSGFLRVVDTLAISNGRSIHLVALGDRVIAVGATAQQISLLNELSEDEAASLLEQTARPEEQPFSQFATQLFESMRRGGRTPGPEQRGGSEFAEVIGGPYER
ncbi:MAG TPA: flagellar biosynthetic protein FliO [Tepidiformaceae bacterium]|nr:flagellar biosynthetic protein FliO [Tepidiformaceae bacterium]